MLDHTRTASKIALAVTLFLSPASFAQMYGVTLEGGQSSLFQVQDHDTVNPVVCCEVVLDTPVADVAASDAGTIYAVSTTSPGYVIEIDPATGATTQLVELPLPNGGNSIAWTPGDVLYVAAYGLSPVWRVDLSDRTVEVALSTPYPKADLTWDPASGDLFLSTQEPNLVRLHLDTGDAELVGGLPGDISIAFDDRGVLYGQKAAAPGDYTYYEIDPDTANATVIAEPSGSLRPVGLGYGARRFQRGECNQDGGVDIGDPINLLSQLFDASQEASCADACDSNDDGMIDIADAVAVLTVLFVDATPLPDPYGECGPDTTHDTLGCRSSTCP